MKKIIICLILGMFLIASANLISADLPNLDEVEQGECITLSQTCASCSYVNISSVSNKHNDSLIENVEMTNFGSGEWRYDFCNTNYLGRYDVRGIGDINGVNEGFAYTFNVTPSGEGGTEYIVFWIILILLLYGLNLMAFFKFRNIPLTILSGMALIFLGIYMVSQGIIIYRDDMTNYIAYLTLSWGIITAIWATIEQFNII